MATTAMETHVNSEHELEDISAQPTTRTTQDETDADYPNGVRLLLITVSLILSIYLSALDSTIVATLIPEMTTEFKSINQVSWYGSAFAMTNAAFLALWGKAYTYFDLKRTFAFSVAVFELGNLLCGFAYNDSMVISGRAIAGAGGAGSMTGCFIMIAYAVRPERRALFMGTLGVTYGVASVTGPLLGGAFVDSASWRWGFWINVPLGVMATAMITASFKTPSFVQRNQVSFRERVINMDMLGVTLALGSVTAFISSMHYLGSESKALSATLIGLLLTSAVLAAIFIVHEKRLGSVAMIQFRFLKHRRFRENCFYTFFLAGVEFPLLFSLPLRFQSVNSKTASGAGVLLIPLVLGVSVFTMVSNWILTFRPQHTTLLMLGAMFSVVGTTLISTAKQQTSTSVWICFELIAAVGLGLALQLPLIVNQASVAAIDIPTATSLTLFFETMGQALFTAASEGAFTGNLLRNLNDFPDSGIDPEMVVKAGATGFRKLFDEDQVHIITRCYSRALQVSHYMCLACAVCAGLVWIRMVIPMLRTRLSAVSADR